MTEQKKLKFTCPMEYEVHLCARAGRGWCRRQLSRDGVRDVITRLVGLLPLTTEHEQQLQLPLMCGSKGFETSETLSGELHCSVISNIE